MRLLKLLKENWRFIQSLIQKGKYCSTTKMFTIILDNGHGVNTPGKCSPIKADGTRFREYSYARKVVQEVSKKLKALGYDVYILTPEEYDVPLGARVNRANTYIKSKGASNCLLISVHNDAAGNTGSWMSGRGWSAWTTRGQNNSDKLAECLYDAAEKYLQGNTTYGKTFQGERIQKPVRKDLSDGDRDYEAGWAIIKGANCPAVLTENLFQDNKLDVSFLESQEGFDTICKIHVDGILDFIKYKRK